METCKKVFIFTLPAAGHTNPVLGLCKELLRRCNFQLIVYSRPQFKQLFESVGAEFRNFNPDVNINQLEKADPYFNVMKYVYNGCDTADCLLKDLYKDALEERPDAILYDNGTIYAKIIVQFILNEFEKKRLDAPKIFGYSTTFQFTRDYPNNFEASIHKENFFISIFYMILLIFKLALINLKYGLSLPFLWYDFTGPLENETTLVFTFAELQPRSHLMSSSVKFVGCSIDQSSHYQGISNRSDSLNERVLETANGFVLFASLGTIFNNNLAVYLKIIAAFKRLIKEGEKFTAIISTGELVFDALKGVELPKEIVLVKSADQIEILKRAAVFITHNGMNSTSEAVHFGVPMICLPLSADQPLVAYRVADELGLGIRLDSKCFGVEELKKALCTLIYDKSFRKRALAYQRLSAEQNGSVNSAEWIIRGLKN